MLKAVSNFEAIWRRLSQMSAPRLFFRQCKPTQTPVRAAVRLYPQPAKADGPAQLARIGDQAGGRAALFLSTDDFARENAAMPAKGVTLQEAPRDEPYGTVAVFQDPFGNLWDMIQPALGDGS